MSLLKLPERWESGLIHRFAKPAYSERGTGGSNPPLSAKNLQKQYCFDYYMVFEYSGMRTHGERGFEPRLKAELMRSEATNNPPLSAIPLQNSRSEWKKTNQTDTSLLDGGLGSFLSNLKGLQRNCREPTAGIMK